MIHNVTKHNDTLNIMIHNDTKLQYVFFVCALLLTIHSPSLSFLLSYHIKLFWMLIFFCFNRLVAPLFIQSLCNKIYVSSKNEVSGPLKTENPTWKPNFSIFISFLTVQRFPSQCSSATTSSFWAITSFKIASIAFKTDCR